jgi:hypothetical protein
MFGVPVVTPLHHAVAQRCEVVKYGCVAGHAPDGGEALKGLGLHRGDAGASPPGGCANAVRDQYANA